MKQLFVAFAMMFVLSPDLAADDDNDFPLLYAHLIVRGVVERFGSETVPYQEWAGEDLPDEARDRPFPIWRARVRIREVLKGECDGTVVDFVVVQPAGDRLILAEGKSYVLCLWYRDGLRGGSYVITSRRGAFRESGDSWIRCSDGGRLQLASIRSVIETTRLPHVVAQSEVIAVGQILSADTIPIEGPDGTRAIVRVCKMDVSSLRKGHLDGTLLEFRMIMTGQYSPEWRTHVPWEMNVGETWYVFLRKGEAGYYPFAGPNGLLKVQGSELIYCNSVKYPHSKTEVDLIVQKGAR